MKYITFIIVVLSIVIASPLYGQDSSDVPDEVIATAQKQTDPAMSAFLAGDYETAEIEFDKNAFCALRVERNFRSGLESARDDSIRSDLSGNINTAPQPTGGPNAGARIGAGLGSTVPETRINGINSSDFQTSNKRRTCENRGFQVYMKGISQLELGKIAEAKKTLIQATKIHRTLYDAHFKISLLEYQDGNLKDAKKELKKLRKIAARCKRCQAKPEIEGQIQYLSVLLEQ